MAAECQLLLQSSKQLAEGGGGTADGVHSRGSLQLDLWGHANPETPDQVLFFMFLGYQLAPADAWITPQVSPDHAVTERRVQSYFMLLVWRSSACHDQVAE